MSLDITVYDIDSLKPQVHDGTDYVDAIADIPANVADVMLLSNGDRWESEIARNIEIDAPYR